MKEGHETLVRRYLAALEKADGEVIAQLFHEQVVHVEHPNRLLPKGLTRDKAGLMAAFAKGQQSVRDQHYELRSMLCEEQAMALRVGWSATLCMALGNSRAGDRIEAEFAMFRDGQIIEQHNYDCFREF